MNENFSWKANSHLTIHFDVFSGVPSMASLDFDGHTVYFDYKMPLIEMSISGTGHWIADDRLIHTQLGREFVLKEYSSRNDEADGVNRLKVTLGNTSRRLRADVVYEAPCEGSMFRTMVTVANEGDRPVTLEQVATFAGAFGTTEGEKTSIDGWTLTEGDYDWLGEGRWKTRSVRDLCPDFAPELTGHDPRGEYRVVSSGTWSTGRHATLAVLENERLQLAWAFQAEHNGAWRWEIGDNTSDGYFAVSGPTAVDHSWTKTLSAGESFTTVPASVAIASTRSDVMDAVTRYRRLMRTKHVDNNLVRVVFNDYMNTINGDPTTEKELPLIEAAAQAGAQVFVIDCGWYDDSGDWWPSVGEWLPSKTRFPGAKGIVEVIDAIKAHGMVPGIWLEPEVIGVKSPMANKLPDSAFFQRDGNRLVEQERYILDFRDSAARSHLDSVIDRLVQEYGIGYFKMDYNVSPGAGTDYQTDSIGEGMLEHNRAYSDWVEGIHKRYPDVILENCSSGGMREDFAQTSRFQVQSTSDQQDWRLYPAIAAAAPMMMLPEQAANWAYPQADMTAEQTVFNINTTFLGRFFLSGYINRMSEKQLMLVKDGIVAYKHYVQPVIAQSTPFWPLGLPEWRDKVIALGIKHDSGSLLTVWCRNADDSEVNLSLPQYAGMDVEVHTIFPSSQEFEEWNTSWTKEDAILHVSCPTDEYVSRTFEIRLKGGQVQK